jgi:hypothetical protein
MTWVMIAMVLGSPQIMGYYTEYGTCLEQMEEFVECGPMWKDCKCEPEITQLRMEASPS